jgi:hypothetical protein
MEGKGRWKVEVYDNGMWGPLPLTGGLFPHTYASKEHAERLLPKVLKLLYPCRVSGCGPREVRVVPVSVE